MPVRSPHGRSAAYRSLWQWPLRSPARLAVTVVLVVAAVVAVSIGLGSLRTERAPLGSPAGSGAATSGRPTAAATPTALPPVPALTPTTLPASRAPQEALQVASRWSLAWVRPAPGVTAEQWLDGLRPYTSEEYLGVLAAVDPANIPAHRVTGEPRPVRVSPRSLQVDVPMDALTLRVLVVDTEQGWRVAGYERV
ncbi:MAG: hypothetical protein AB7J32_08175 [Pseudonocardia sp.]